MKSNIGTEIIEKAKEKGAAMAGMAPVELLENSPSHKIIKLKTGLEIEDFAGITWPEYARSALVVAVSHPENEPELDWWDTKSSPGNSVLVKIIRELALWIQEDFGIKTQEMPYAIRKGGMFLKDAAVLSGLGCIGKNNMLVTPELGPRVRLRAMLIAEDLPSTGPIDFDPCESCEEPCRKACPQDAFEEITLSSAQAGMPTLPGRDGFFGRAKCWIQMHKDYEDSGIDREEIRSFALDSETVSQTDTTRARFCRKCEFACPIGR
jgi:epoxyqueuosine reductase